MTDSPFPPGAVLAYYLRSSSDRQELSVPRQEALVLEWCKEHGYLVGRGFKDAGRSGLRLTGRSAFAQMIEYFQSGQAMEAGLLLYEYTRFSRDYDNAAYYLATLRREGIIIYSLTDKIPEGTIGRVVESLYLWQSEDESRRLGARSAAGQRYVAETYHSYPSWHCPVGYKFDPQPIGKRTDGRDRLAKCLVPDPSTAPLVTRAFHMRAQGRTLSEIHAACHLLNAAEAYSRMLRNEIYLGILNWGGARIEGFCEPLVDPDTWTATQAIHAGWSTHFSHRYTPRGADSPYLLSGLVVCGRCGKNMTGIVPQRNKSPLAYYRCTGCRWSASECGNLSIRVDYLDQFVLERVKEYLTDSSALWDAYQAMLTSTSSIQAESQARHARVQADLDATQKAVANILSAIREAGHSVAMLRELAELEEREHDLRQELSIIPPAPILPALDQGDLAAIAASTWKDIEQGNHRERQITLRSLIESIVVKRTKSDSTPSIAISFYALPRL